MLIILWFLLLSTAPNPSLSTRTFGNSSLSRRRPHHAIAFYMRDILCTTTVIDDQLPSFQNPRGVSAPNAEAVPNSPTGFYTQTVDLSGTGLSLPARAALKELEFGSVTAIDEALYQDWVAPGSPVLIGRAQGIYVASSEDRASHMVAMTATLSNGDALRFFGVHQSDTSEYHIAVIGGTGKYHNANGYAAVRTVDLGSDDVEGESEGAYKLLLFNVYLG